VFSELMYNPAGTDAEGEWIELYNQLSVDIDLSRWRLEGDVQFQFPPETRVPSGGFVIIARNPLAPPDPGDAPVFGPLNGQLDNGGGTVQLLNANGRVMDELDYNDDGDWPIGPDGSGSSLAKFDLRSASSDPDNWMTSSTLGGSPGRPNGEVNTNQPRGLQLSEVPAGGQRPFWIELRNATRQSLSAADYALRIVGSVDVQFPLADATVAAGEQVVIDADQLNPAPRAGDRLFLLEQTTGAVVDAIAVDSRAIGRSDAHQGKWWFTAQVTPGQMNQFAFESRVVINEIMYHHAPTYETQMQPLIESNLEWIELFNRGQESVDLSGWQMDKGIDFEFPLGAKIAPQQYALLVSDRAAMLAEFPHLAELIVGQYAGGLSNRGETLRLLDAAGNVADQVEYFDGGRWPQLADGGGSSLELIDPDADNASAEAWAASWEGDKSQWQSFTYRGTAREPSGTSNPRGFNELIIGLLDAGDILIDDLRVVEDPDGAAIEHLQNGTFEQDTSGEPPADWRIVGNHRRSYVTVDPDDATNHVLRLIATGATEHMSNHAETTFADDDALARNAEVEIAFRARWLGGSPRLNTRLYFNQLGESFILPLPGRAGTPGSANSRRVDNSGPTYDHFLHQPLIPDADQAVTVTARASDSDGIDAMTLYYAVNDGDFQRIAMSADETGLYGATIPGQRSGRTVQFYVEARDVEGATSTFPAAGPASRALYRVGSRTAPDGATTLRLVMTPGDVALMHTNTNVMSNDRMGGTVILDNRDVFYDVGVRLRGSGYGRNDARTGFNISFDPGHLFRGVHSSVAVDRGVVLSSGNGQGPVQGVPGASPHELLIHHIANHAGGLAGMYDDVVYFDAPRTTNAGLGLLKMARYGNDYLDSQFTRGSDGSLFELELIYYFNRTAATDPEALKGSPNAVLNADVRSLGGDQDAFRLNFVLKNNRDLDDFSRIIELGQSLMLRDSELQSAAQEVMDIESWMRYQALQSLVGTADTFNMGLGHNLYLYVRPDDQRVLPFPWDVDHGFFYNSNASLTGQGGTRFARLVGLPWNTRLVYKHLLDVIETTYNLEHLQPWIDHYTELTRQNLAGFFTDYIGARSSFVAERIETLVPRVELEITTNDGEDFWTDDTAVTLSGRGWVNVHQLRSPEGDLLPLRWVSLNEWELTVPVAPGANRIELQALDLRGRAVGSDSIVVSRRGGVTGDFDGDGRVSADDVDLLCAAIAHQDLKFDLNRDSVVDREDQDFLLEQILGTTRGDVDLNGRFDSSDLVSVFQSGQYEDSVAGNSGWREGDWNCDGEFTSSDLVAAFADGGYIAEAIAAMFRAP
jgi:hypothetical protein